MPLVLIRIDDRLIHGQVVVGWGKVLQPDWIVLCSDEVANSEWQRNIYLSAVSDEISASVVTIEETITNYHSGNYDRPKVIMLVDNPATIIRLVEGGVQINSVNVGGMHFQPGKTQIAGFIFLDQVDIDSFRLLHQRGIKLEGRDVPGCPSIDIAKTLKFD